MASSDCIISLNTSSLNDEQAYPGLASMLTNDENDLPLSMESVTDALIRKELTIANMVRKIVFVIAVGFISAKLQLFYHMAHYF